MSLAELKKQVIKLSESEREELEVFMQQYRYWNTPEKLAELARSMHEMEGRKWHTQEEVEALHQRLISEGR